MMGFAAFIIGPAKGRTRWLNPSYGSALAAMTITFRPLDMSDMPRLAAWLMEPHVRKFYQPAPITLDEVTAEYAPMIGNDTSTICHLAISQGTPFAYVQSYRNLDYPEWAEMIDVRDGISVDLFIGEPAFLHRGMGRALLVAYLHEVALAHFAETRAYIAHATANASALRCSQAAGFRPVREFLEHGVPTLLLKREAEGKDKHAHAFLSPRAGQTRRMG